ncbi:hypothetical protein [Sporolactobacillus laevolacticus]|uniref:Uncharacterized protein n=1 Tax=Sporolactobacillus laevolacticus DSM 442 TaxID=1395513 RepID=V6IZF5_9BACL|nr:hypothetical protein [Sporolactobacillus laevolacticus]EST12948.1 hypothetical protein P343_04835 [Sporolactobacillus laevolacticus DSM 442]MDF2911486.1 hypothetical protein [Sporolactobacillus laevolacticus]MDN3954169.1 hypothetical protein [Sporolactobacillus laevolacticus]
MEEEKVISLAEKIIQMDLKRDELYEELIVLSGNRASEILRTVQNR